MAGLIAAGFDIGTHRIAMSVPVKEKVTHIDLSRSYRGRRDEELVALRQWVREVAHDGLVAFIEQPFVSGGHGMNPSVTIGMSETVGIIRSARSWASSSVMVSPGAWKKALTGNHHATKDQVRAWLLEREPNLGYLNEDEADAYCIGLYGQGVLEGHIELPVKKTRRRKKRVTTKEEA